MTDRVTISVTEGVADVRLNRPDKVNALDGPMFAALVEAGETVVADRSIRAVVLSGEGRGFCAGLDVAAFMGAAPDEPRDGDQGGSSFSALAGRGEGRIANVAQQVAYTWTEMAVPVIAAVHGVALGGGIQIALGADIRIVAPDAKLSVLEIRWGLLPDMTGLQMLPKLVGLDVAKELAFTGRMVSGTEALALGLATRVSTDPRQDALALAADIAARNPAAVQASKALLNAAGSRPLAESFLEETRLMTEVIGSDNQLEAVASYLEKRPPCFTDPT